MAQHSTPISFKPADGHGYVLDKSHLEACRLNLQHMLFREVFQFSIHPSLRTYHVNLPQTRDQVIELIVQHVKECCPNHTPTWTMFGRAFVAVFRAEFGD
jgi:hypothetical protein